MNVTIFQDNPKEASILMDGVNVADAVRGVDVIMEAGALPRVTLDLVMVDVSIAVDQPQIMIPASTRHLLIELGWTPPMAERGYRVDLIKGK